MALKGQFKTRINGATSTDPLVAKVSKLEAEVSVVKKEVKQIKEINHG